MSEPVKSELRPPLVSVVLSVKNGMPFLPEAIDSIVNQTFVDWELIINDNGSDDGSAEYVGHRQQSDQRIRLIRNEAGRSHSGGLNRAIEASCGEWIARMDSDDRALASRFEQQLAFVAKNSDVVTTSPLAFYIDSEGRRVGQTYHDLVSREAFARYMETNEAIGILHPGAFIRADVLREIGGYRPEYDPANDTDLWSRLSEKGLILVQTDKLMEYRIHGSASSRSNFVMARMKHEWVRASMIARRAGAPEPTWEEFRAEWHSQPLSRRVNRWRKMQAKRMYREAGLSWIRGQRLRAGLTYGGSALLQPRYAADRLRGQFLRSSRARVSAAS